MFSLTKKLLDIKWKEFKVRNRTGTYEIDKIPLSCFDDKRFVLDNEVHTLAYFHKDCNKKCDKNENKIENNNNENKNEKYNENENDT